MNSSSAAHMTVVVQLRFFSKEAGGRAVPVVASSEYRPHVVVDGGRGGEHYLGVEFVGDDRVLEQDVEHVLMLRLLYFPEVDYSALVPGARFTLREGPNIIGRGHVVDGPRSSVTEDLRPQLEALSAALAAAGDLSAHRSVREALDGSPDRVPTFLRSNELWGGAGSIADQGGLDASTEARRAVERALVELGERQLASGNPNVRTEMWMSAFRPRA